MTNRKRNLAMVEKRRRQRANEARLRESNAPKKYTEEEADLIAYNITAIGFIVFMLLAMGLGMLIV